MTGAIWKSAFVAAFFALHPLHVESVAWISERKDVMSMLFGIMTLCLYVYYTEKPVIIRYLLVLCCFILALMSKPMVVTLPFVMLLLDYWPLERLQSRKIEIKPVSVPVEVNKGKKKAKSKKEALRENISQPVAPQPSKPKLWRVRGLLKNSHLRRCASTRTAQRMSIYASRFVFLRALHMNVFEQPLKMGFFNNPIIPLWQIREKVPFFILSAVFSILTIYTQPDKSADHFPFVSLLANAIVSFVVYLGKTFYPHNMAVYYPFHPHMPLWQVIGAILLIIVISAAVILTAKRLPFLFTGWFWYAITIAPVLGIIQISMTAPYAMADRYHYLPSIGLAVGLAWGIPVLFNRDDVRKNILLPAGMIFIAILSLMTWQQCRHWKNSIALWIHTVQVTDNNYLALNNLGNALYDRGKIKDAIYYYNEALRINPDYDKVYFSRGNAYHSLGQYQLAIADYSEAIRINPAYAKAYFNRGTICGETGQYQQALNDFSEAIRLKPDYKEAYINRGSMYNDIGLYQNAIENYSEAIELNPDNADFYINRAIIYLSQGINNRGCPDLHKACHLGSCILLQKAIAGGYCR